MIDLNDKRPIWEQGLADSIAEAIDEVIDEQERLAIIEQLESTARTVGVTDVGQTVARRYLSAAKILRQGLQTEETEVEAIVDDMRCAWVKRRYTQAFLDDCERLIGAVQREYDSKFKPCVMYSPEIKATEMILEDATVVWQPWGPYKGHAVDLGYSSDGRLIGIKIWDDVRFGFYGYSTEAKQSATDHTLTDDVASPREIRNQAFENAAKIADDYYNSTSNYSNIATAIRSQKDYGPPQEPPSDGAIYTAISKRDAERRLLDAGAELYSALCEVVGMDGRQHDAMIEYAKASNAYAWPDVETR